MNRAQRRALERQRRKANKAAKESANEFVADWTYTGGNHSYESDPEPQIPGVTVRPVDPEFDAKVSRNSWHDREEFMEFVKTIQLLSMEDVWEEDGNTLKPGCVNWSWARNFNCKYVNLRIDMRDGGFIFTDDTGQRINLEQLKWQYKSAKERDQNG